MDVDLSLRERASGRGGTRYWPDATQCQTDDQGMLRLRCPKVLRSDRDRRGREGDGTHLSRGRLPGVTTERPSRAR